MRLDAFMVGSIGLAAYVFGGLDVLGFREAETEGSVLLSLGIVASVVSRLAWRAKE